MEETPNFGGNTRPQSGMEPHEDVAPTVDQSYLNLDQYGTQRRRKDPTAPHVIHVDIKANK